MTQPMGPATERLHLIDSLRAVALFGVIVMNIMAMVMGFVGADVAATAKPWDMAAGLFDLVLLQGKARSTFALLFGVGFGILMARAAARGDGFTGFYMRRMTALLALGVFNLLFLFWGDILIVYALLGMVLLLFRGWSQRGLLTLGLILVIVPPLLLGLFEAITGAPAPNLAGLPAGQADAVMTATTPIYRDGSYLEVMAANVRYYVNHHLNDTAYAVVYDIGVLGLFLLGLWTARAGVLSDVERWRPVLRRIVWVCLPLGLALSIAQATRRMGIPLDGAGYAFVSASYVGLPVMAFGYIAALSLLLTRAGKGLQPLLAPMGRMALTGYLASNLIGGFVWYGWGLGLIGQWNVGAINLLAIALSIGLCLFSALWLRRFRFGPVEWLWRSVSYGRLQPLRRESPQD